MKITLIKTFNNNFKIAHDSDYEIAKKIPVNEPIVYEWTKVRNYKFHKKFFALMKLVYENQEVYNNMECMRKDLTINAGFYSSRFDFKGIEVIEADSISFASMDENQFQEFYSKVIDVVVKWLSIDKQDILDNIEQHF
jgi:Protein of unknown function (DUF1367)